MAETSIEWSEHVWNPIVGCSVVSPGCTNCYAMRMAARLERMGQDRYAGLTKPSKAGAVWTGELRLVDEALTIPLRRRKPTTYFVNSMSDLFHESVPDAWIDRVFAVMALCPQHTFQVLTKRWARMRSYLTGENPLVRLHHEAAADFTGALAGIFRPHGNLYSLYLDAPWPFPNVWLGISAEDQRRADERVPDLLATPAAVRWVSAEPLLGPIDFTDLGGPGSAKSYGYHGASAIWPGNHVRPCLDWIVVGGESGPGARPMHPDWARQIRDDCEAAGTAFLFKQWGEYRPYRGEEDIDCGDCGFGGHSGPALATCVDRPRGTFDVWPAACRCEDRGPVVTLGLNGVEIDPRNDCPSDCRATPPYAPMIRVGKKAAGRLLDGKLHDAMPGVRHVG